MKRAHTPLLLVVALVASPSTRPRNEPKETVLFMCPYGGAKSGIAASYFNRVAEAAGLLHVASAAAAETPYEAVPQPVAAADLESAAKVVSIDCDLTRRSAGMSSSSPPS